MRLVLVCAFTVFTSLSAGAHSIQHEAPSLPSAPAELLGADASGLTEKIGQALLAELGVPSLQSFQVHWNSPDFQCLRVSHEMDDSMVSGTCLVKATAFQVSAISQISAKDGKLQVSILSAVLE